MKTAREVAFNVRGRSRPWRASPYSPEWSRMTSGLATRRKGRPERQLTEGQSVWCRDGFWPVPAVRPEIRCAETAPQDRARPGAVQYRVFSPVLPRHRRQIAPPLPILIFGPAFSAVTSDASGTAASTPPSSVRRMREGTGASSPLRRSIAGAFCARNRRRVGVCGLAGLLVSACHHRTAQVRKLRLHVLQFGLLVSKPSLLLLQFI
jgi:hypothetical protein